MLAKALQGATAAADKLYIEDVMSTFLYTGNGSTQTITNGIDLSGKGGLVWCKHRSGSGSPATYETHCLYDTARGAGRVLRTNETGGQLGSGQAGYELYSFGSSGFNVGGNNNYNINTSGALYASWTFRKAAKFFDVVTYTGNGTNRTIAHNLGSVPGCIIVKRTDAIGNWYVYHRSLTSNAYYLLLDTTQAQSNAVDFWNSTTPTSIGFSISSLSDINANGGTYVAYLFAHDAGGFGDSGNDNVVSCGGFTHSGANAVQDLGWEPQFLLIKRTDIAGDWKIVDTMRGWTVAGSDMNLYPNLSSAEVDSGLYNPVATGFDWGQNGTFIYIAIRRGPMKKPTDATKVFSANTWTGTGTTQQITTGFFPDACLTIDRNKAATNLNYLFDNLRGVNVESYTNSTAAEGTDSGKAFTMTGLSNNSGNLNSTLGVYVGEFFRRAPGFFDVVAYTGTGVARTVSHNLGVAPELLIFKARNSTSGWITWSSSLSLTENLTLNSNAAKNTGNNFFNSTAPSTSVITLSDSGAVNQSSVNYIAYLFATCPGVSKVGSYTGTGTTLNVDCGFTNGSRLVLIKRTDSTGDWYVWDTARGIISGNDPYLWLNSTVAEVTNTDFIDPLSSGFQISSTAPAAINANGGSFIFFAVA